MGLKLTPKQQKILLLIRDWQLTKGFSPTLQEVADELGVSKVTVFEHVEALIKKGALRTSLCCCSSAAEPFHQQGGLRSILSAPRCPPVY